MPSIRLTGPWRLAIDPDDIGRSGGWASDIPPDSLETPVPGIIQQVVPDYHGVAWYWTRFMLPAQLAGRRALVDFGAVDHKGTVWVNGRELGSHEGGDSPFTMDATDALDAEGDNLLAVRVVNPTEQPIDGLVLAETAHGNKRISGYRPGNGYDFGGILLPVEVRVVPSVRIDDVAVTASPATGAIRATLTLCNDLAKTVPATLHAMVVSGQLDAIHDAADQGVALAPGSAHLTVDLSVADPRLWDTADPFLYRLTLTLASHGPGNAATHARQIRFGFRDFRVVDGAFHLNGRRIFLKSTHTGNHYPIGSTIPPDPEFYRRDLVHAKAIGFNMVRYISGLARPEQLDFCDELGLLIYEESAASWLLGPSPHMAARFDAEVRAMIERDRNHPSVVVWGLLNETYDGPVFRHAVDALGLVRELDDSRLVVLASGRWDAQPSIGSVANPGSTEWQHAWGIESPDAEDLVITPTSWVGSRGPQDFGRMAYLPTAGDVHLYPYVPHDDGTEDLVRTMGVGTKPVYLSELGIGSLFDAVREARGFEAAGVRPDVPDGAYIRMMAEGFVADWERLGFDDVYPFPEDFLTASAAHMARQRATTFDLIRSNPQIVGYNLTGMLDHGLTGEGLWTFWRTWKPGIVDVVSAGWAPLRWCLFARPLHAVAGAPIRLEAVMANDGVLRAGEYPVRFRLFGPAGLAWEREAVIRVPSGSPERAVPFAQPVLEEVVDLPSDPGVYTFAASLLHGGDARADRRAFRVSAPVAPLEPRVEVTAWGLPPSVRAWLAEHGVATQRPRGTVTMRPVILIGDPSTDAEAGDAWPDVADAVRDGATAVILGSDAYLGDGADLVLPIAPDLSLRWTHDWLYHKDCVARRHPLFAGLSTGLLDWDEYGQTIPHHVVATERVGEVVAASFTVGAPVPNGYGSGILAAAFPEGAGRILVSTFRILEHVGVHPAADRLLLNLVRVAAGVTPDDA